MGFCRGTSCTPMKFLTKLFSDDELDFVREIVPEKVRFLRWLVRAIVSIMFNNNGTPRVLLMLRVLF